MVNESVTKKIPENHEISQEILNILSATPSEEKEPGFPFKMPKNEHHWLDREIRIEENWL